ncbi:hypothetical protein D7Z54_09245 [Salibacterium salarium]|uniref:Uncharacterized protein n=1 Tax=Salibacterium salarium TaxID=284579 RepID=A0A3R9PA79_9BACI|nr:DUF3221 domain-containing protein [Salibacterium salarium]RSL33861.1 hypothetical protein D7Z54_09245 [Salibacterium salarium]
MKIIRGMTIRRVSLIYLSYDNTRRLNTGNKVEVQINGGIDQTHPAQAEARRLYFIPKKSEITEL